MPLRTKHGQLQYILLATWHEACTNKTFIGRVSRPVRDTVFGVLHGLGYASHFLYAVATSIVTRQSLASSVPWVRTSLEPRPTKCVIQARAEYIFGEPVDP